VVVGTAVLANIQILRAFAALAVVAYHTNYRVPGLLHTDFLGVAIFFVISGFIMSYIRETAGVFLVRRIIRIVPLYWLGTCLYAAMVVLIYPRIGKATDNTVTLSTFLQDIFFVPRFDRNEALVFPVLGVGWTLNLEMYFYTLFAAMLFINRRLAPILVGATLLAFWIVARMFTPSPFVSFLAHDYVVYFVFGITVFYLWRAIPKSASVGGLCLVSGFCMLVYFAISGSDLSAKLAAPMIVLGAVILESAGYPLKLRAPLLLGSASYALYLFHPFIIGLARAGFTPDSNVATATIVTATCVVLAIFIHKRIEIAILSKLRGLTSMMMAKSLAKSTVQS